MPPQDHRTTTVIGRDFNPDNAVFSKSLSSKNTADSVFSAKKRVNDITREKELDSKIIYEFGGPAGVTFIMIFFPTLMVYLWLCLERHNGFLVSPLRMDFWTEGLPLLKPNWHVASLYLGFNGLQALTAVTMPGVIVKGLPIPSLGGRQLQYLCNGVATWYFDIALFTFLHMTKVLPLTNVIENMGPLLFVAIIWSFFVSFGTYIVGIASRNTHRMSGSIAYDLFMGAILNPRIGKRLDLKMWSEIRIPWKILFLITTSAALKDHEVNYASALAGGLPARYDLFGGALSVPIIYTSSPILFMTLAHFLYANACMKGEECIPTTWDIFYEKWGFMLIFWNFAGVPFSYCYSSLYLMSKSLHGQPVTHGKIYTTFLFLLLLAAYFVWDTANSQKNRFRMQERGTYVERSTFPQLPYGTLKDPRYILTKQGNKLLIGGWWGVARKIHYTSDLVMALSWGLITGFGSFIPYFYFCFFVAVLTHRVSRDTTHCKEKYGEDWDKYCQIVPYIFIPGVY